MLDALNPFFSTNENKRRKKVKIVVQRLNTLKHVFPQKSKRFECIECVQQQY